MNVTSFLFDLTHVQGIMVGGFENDREKKNGKDVTFNKKCMPL